MQEEREIRSELEPGERLLWSGQPSQGLRFTWLDLYTIPFGLFFTGFAAVWVVMAYQSSPLFALFGLPFFLAGAFMAFGRFFVEAKQRARTHHAVTDRRAIIVSGLLNRTVNSLDLATLNDVAVTEKKSGRGTVNFGSRSVLDRLFGQFGAFGSFGYNPMDTSSFQLIEQPRKVYATVLDAKRAALRQLT